MLKLNAVEYVSKIKSILSIIFYSIYGLYISLVNPIFVMTVRMCTLCYHHRQIGRMNHCLVLGHEIMV